MKQKQVLLSLLLVLALLLCLLPATALAASAPETADSGEGTDVIDEEVLEEAEALLAEEIVESSVFASATSFSAVNLASATSNVPVKPIA